jgi:hypothetical protein
VAAPSIHLQTKRRYTWDGAAEIEQQRVAPAPPFCGQSKRLDSVQRLLP